MRGIVGGNINEEKSENFCRRGMSRILFFVTRKVENFTGQPYLSDGGLRTIEWCCA